MTRVVPRPYIIPSSPYKTRLQALQAIIDPVAGPLLPVAPIGPHIKPQVLIIKVGPETQQHRQRRILPLHLRV
jgi:hypothetical protein